MKDGNWKEANIYCEKVLDQEPRNAQAYLGKLMAELHVRYQEDLKKCKEPFNNRSNFQKAVRFGDTDLSSALNNYISYINNRNKISQLNSIYNNAVRAMKSADNESAYKDAAAIFKTVKGFKNADDLAKQCLENAETCRKDAVYSSAMYNKNALVYEGAIILFRTIPGWKDADKQFLICQKEIEKKKANEETRRLEQKRRDEEKYIETQRRKHRIEGLVVVLVLVMVVGLSGAALVNNVIIPNNKYNAAVSLYNDGKYDEAITAFQALNGFKDSESQIEKCNIGKYGKEQYELFNKVQIGDTFEFGTYEQDNQKSNGKEKIEWIILDKKDMSLLLISKYALDCCPFHSSDEEVTWDTCSLRKWLRKSFISTAFSKDERKLLQDTSLTTSKGAPTMDKVFLLSITEVQQYFSSDNARACSPTQYAVAQGALVSTDYISESNGYCWWWLRSSGRSFSRAAIVQNGGHISVDGGMVFSSDNAVRPAVWVNLGNK